MKNNMKKRLTLFLLAAAIQTVGAQQLPNTTFDAAWVNCFPWEAGNYASSARGTQPEGWCISNVSQSALPIVGEEVTPGANGSGKAVKLMNVSASIGSNNAPGYITLGTAWATAETKMTSVQNADGGVFGGIAFSHHPDAVRFTYKCDRDYGEENMSVVAYLWKGTWTQKDVPSNTAVGVFSWGNATKVTMTDRIHNILGKDCLTGGEISKSDDAALIASAEYFSSAAQNEWTTKEIPLNYGAFAKKPVNVEKLNIVIASNGLFDDRNLIKSGNSVTIDDVELVYYHALSSLSFEGATLNFSENTTNYYLSSVEYDEAKLAYTIKGQAATATKSYDEETGVLTIRVEGEDIAVNPNSFTEYKVQFKANGANPGQVTYRTYPLDLYVTINGETREKQVAEILVETLESGNINFVLKNFVLKTDEEPMPIGNIVVNGLEVAGDGSFSFKGNLQLEEGDDPAYTTWYGPTVTSMAGGSVPIDLCGKFVDENTLMVYISINMESSLGYKVIVHLGYARATMVIKADDKYGTFCAPFAITLPSGVQAFTVKSATDNGLLSLSKVNFFIPANTPVVVFSEDGLALTEFYGLPVAGTPVSGMLTGVFEDTEVPENRYVLQNKEGKVGFYQVTGGQRPVIGANRCYMTSKTGAPVFYFEAEDIDGHVPFSLTEDLYYTLRGASQGGEAWDANGGIRLGNSSDIFSWGDKFSVIVISGIPDKLSFTYSSSKGASGRQYVIYESADGENFTEIWRDNKGSGVDGNSYQSGDIQLRPDTRYIKFFYYGNCAAYYRDIRITELVRFESDTEEIVLSEKKRSTTFVFSYANAGSEITITVPQGITVNPSKIKAGIDVYGEKTIRIAYNYKECDVDDDIIISDGVMTERIHVRGSLENPDAVRGIEEAKNEGPVYNLSGQRIDKMQKGINVLRGKKVLK